MVDPGYFRPAEVESLLGDATKAHERLGWRPRTTVEEMIGEMMRHDLEMARRHALLSHHGYDVPVSLDR